MDKKSYQVMRRIGMALHTLNTVAFFEDVEKPGLIRTGGNIGLRSGRSNDFFVTGREVRKHNLKSRDIVEVRNGRAIGNLRPSREVLIHERIFATMPHINVVIHTHDNLILSDRSLPCTRRPSFAATMQDAEEVCVLLQKSPVINLKSHGQIIIAHTPRAALHTLIRFHAAALRKLRKTV